VLDLRRERRRGGDRDRNHTAVRVLAIAATWVAAMTCGAPITTPPGSTQLVTVSATGYGATVASLELWQRSGGCWKRVGGPWHRAVSGLGA
jgi:hypothetical protein